MEVVFTPLAERHTDKLHEYIATRSGEERADVYITRIVDFCRKLADFPLRGMQRNDISPDCG